MFKKTKKRKNRLAISMILFLFVFNSLGLNLLLVKEVDAVGTDPLAGVVPTTFQTVKDTLKKAWETWEIAEAKIGKHWAAVGFKAALHGFLRKLAIDSATWVASGDKGQKPMIFTSNWKEYMADAADEAAGTFIMASADQWDKNSAEDKAEANAWDKHNNCCEEMEIANEELCQKECKGKSGRALATCFDNCVFEHRNFSPCNDQLNKDINTARDSKGPTAGSAGARYSKGLAGSIVKFLCEPDFDIKMKITADLTEIQRPRKPRCTASRAMRNWDEFVDDPDFLTRFQGYWNPEDNDIGIALTMHNDLLNQMKIAQLGDAKGREEGLGFKAVTNKIGDILTPGTIVQEAIGLQPIKKGTEFETVYTTDIIADSIATFANTLMSKLINKWVMEGMAKLRGEDSGSSSDYNWISGVDSSASREAAKGAKGAKAAKAKYSKVFQPDYKVGGAYSILEKLLMCPDLENMGSTDCVITQPFADAINQELTVQQAIDEGYISVDLPFGFEADGMEPLYNQGYPYRSLIILRKYRIIPVGWELAARYIGDFISNSSGARIYNIQEITDAFDDSASPFYQLIDPNWVLKAPELFCGLEGIGEKIISEEISQGVDVNKDGDYDDESDHAPRINILREGYCADEKSCLMEDSKGNCLFYGYCSEEKRIWDFQGDKCESYHNTCQSFISPQGEQVSYLKNSLDYSGCDEDNAGCKWYCDSRNAGDNGWACLSEGWDLNLDNYCADKDGCEILDSEDIDQDGDTLESCVVPHKGIECILDGSKARLTYNRDLVPNVNNDIYLNQKAESCSSSSSGCREYIRTKPNLGTNLITNSSFENIAEDDIVDDGIVDSFIEWTSLNGEASSASFISNTAFKSLDSAASKLNKVIDTGYSLEGRKFILSFYAQNCMDADFQFYITDVADPNIKIASSTLETITENNDDWERFSVAYNFPSDGTIKAFDTKLTINISGAAGGIPIGCLIDAVQLEEVSGDGYLFSYEGYHNSNSLYLKKAPDYYHCEWYTVYKDDYDSQENCEVIFNNAVDCGTAGYIWDAGVCIYSIENRDPARHFWRTDINRCVKGGSKQCADFALECGQDDVGCNLYAPVNGDPSIPGVVRSDDFCPEDCNGYDTYKQEATFFENIKFPEFFIPDNEKKCSAQNAGCSEFTNLDKLKEGGEAVEYYTYMRPCHKIDTNCASFYTWVGSAETGFQLVAHLLLDANSDGIPDNVYSTTTASDIFGDCDDYDDAINNPECNEFYSEGNLISYRHYKNTVSCSDGCHPYRKTKSSQADCVIYSFGGWNWGEWIGADNECIYESLPEQGIKCPSSQNNCYEYKGNTSHNVRKVIDDGFESAINNWGSGAFSSESLIRGGHSLKVGNLDEMDYALKAHCDYGIICNDEEGCGCKVNDETACYVQKGEQTCVYKSLLGYQKTYFLSFWAKGSGNLEIGFSSASSTDEKFASGSISLGPEWREYSLGPVLVDWDMDSDDPVSVVVNDVILETLKISGFTGDSYIDNIILKEERDNLFLIRPDFWNVPPSCDQDHNNAYAPQYMLGCEEYKSEIDKENVFLKSFSRLCDEGAVGCEALIDTFNSYNYLEEIFNLADKSEITVFADKVDFLVNSKSKTCKERDKGCVALGMAKYRYNQNNTTENFADDRDDLYQYETIYKINDPDKYSDTLCLFNDVGCGKFSSEIMGDYYFKDPVSQRVKGDAKICEYKMAGGQTTAGWYLANTTSGEPNCQLAYSGVGVEYAAKTCLGGGEKSGEICENDTDCPGGYCVNWTGVCPSEADGCTEYLDPLSLISKNIVFNGDFEQDVGPPVGPDGWGVDGADYVMDVPIYLEQDTVYTVLSHSNGAGSRVVLENCVDTSGSPMSSDNPVAYWDFEDGTGSSVLTDRVGVNDGILQFMDPATDWVTGKYGTALEFDGVNQFVQGTVTPLGGAGTLTVKAWIKPQDISADHTGIVTKDDVPFSRVFALNQSTTDGELSFCVYLDNENATCIDTDSSVITNNKWYHIVATYDGHYQKIYVDGFLIKISTDLNTILPASTSPYQIGRNNGIFFNGIIDEVKIYNYALGADEIIDGLTSPDDSMDIIANGAQIVSDENNMQFSGRFYTGRESPISCDLRVSGNLVPDKFVKILKTGIYYNIDSSIDKVDCNGLVDYEKGCVLFNRREIYQDLALEDIIYDADRNTKDENTPQSCSNATSTCDSNLLVKVKPTRACGEWLYCKSKIKVKEDEKCTEIGLCNSLDDKGMCDGFVIKDQINQTAGAGISLSDIRDKSGYAKIGKSWGAETIDGYYPFQEMRQKGGKVLIPNGNFEEDDSYPQGWISERSGYDGNYFSIINNPLTAQKNGLDKRAPEGKNFLKVGSDYPIISPLISLVSFEQGATYHISAYISTENLTTGSAQIHIKELDGAENVIRNYYNLPDLSMDYSQSWQHRTASFKVHPSTERISVKILAVNDPTGNFYIDDVKIKPVLHISDIDNYSPQTCRSYPKTSSLSCEYFDDAGIKNLGRYGYCIESDPVNPRQCLMWWPVDLLLGEGIEEGAGYDGRFPVYYCEQFISRRLALVEYREGGLIAYDDCGAGSNKWCKGCGCAGVPLCPTGYTSVETESGCGFPNWDNENWYYCNVSGASPCGSWFPTDGDLQSFGGNSASFNEATHGLKLCDLDTGELFALEKFPELFYCTNLTETVTSMGQNKYWASRVYEGGDYIVPRLKYEYLAGYQPFGGLVPPSPANNPYEWDSIKNTATNKNIEPLFVKSFSDPKDYAKEVNAGSPYSCIGGCAQAGLCNESRMFCYDLGVPTCGGAVAPISFTNIFQCPTTEVCQTPFPVTNINTGIELIKRLFAQNYSSWAWDGSRYTQVSGQSWLSPNNLCPGSPPIRPKYDPATRLCGGGDCLVCPGATCDWCGVPPIVDNIYINGNTGIYIIKNAGLINLTFNTIIDSEQLPLRFFTVDWGDGIDGDPSIVIGSGTMEDKPNPDNPHSMYHLYGYWDMLSKDNNSVSIECGGKGDPLFGGLASCPADSPCCAVQPKIKIKDNWDWCNSGVSRGDCTLGKIYNGYIVVSQY